MPKRPPQHRPLWQQPPEAQRITRNREHDARRRTEQPWRKWYSTARWRALRAHQLHAEPFCAMCKDEDRLTLATVCDHVTPHRGDEFRFWYGPFASLCASCHNSRKQRIEAKAIRAD